MPPVSPTPLSRTSKTEAFAVARAMRSEIDAWAGARRDAVFDGVLDERLKDQPRHFGVERVWIDVVVDRETILEPRLFDLQGTSGGTRAPPAADHAGGIRSRESDAKQIAQPADHPVGGVGLGMNQRRDRVQRVEEKVRVQLRFERLQPRLGEPRFEAARR